MNEIGPRITMILHKIEEGICEGEVLYHDLFHKTEDEIEKLKDEKEIKRWFLLICQFKCLSFFCWISFYLTLWLWMLIIFWPIEHS